MDIDAQIAAVDRGLTGGTRDGAATHVQTLAQTYPAPIDDVWDALTSAERIPRWFLPVSGDLRLGGRYQVEGNAGGTIESYVVYIGFDALDAREQQKKQPPPRKRAPTG